MGWLADTFPKIFGSPDAAALARSVDAAPGVIFGDESAKTDAYKILQGMFPWGTPPARGTRELLLLYSASPWLRAAVSRIARSVAQTQWRLYAIRDTGTGTALRMKGLQKASPVVRSRILRDIRAGLVKGPSGAPVDVEVIDDHPMLDFLEAGNSVINGHDSQMVSEIHHELKGDSYWLLERWQDGPLKGKPKQFWPIPPYWVQLTPTVDYPAYRIQHQGWQVVVPETDIVWDRDPDPLFPYGRGTGVAESISDELQTDENASKFVNAWFYNRALPAAIVSLDGGDRAEAKRMQSDWRQKYAGALKAFQVHFTSAKVSVAQLQNTFEQMQLIDLRKFERDTILQSIGYPGEILGVIENANRSTIDTAAYRLEKYCIEPRRERRRRLMQGRLCREWDERIFVDYVPEVPEDKDFLLLAAKSRPYAFTNNEFRSMIGSAETDETWGAERPPTPTAAPVQAETIPASGGGALGADPEWTKRLDGRVQLLELAVDEGPPRRLLLGAKAQEQDDQHQGPDWSDDDIPDIAGAVDDQAMIDSLAKLLADAVQDFGEQAFASVAAGGSGGGAFDGSNPAVTDYLDTFAGEGITDIGDTTRDYLKQRLAEGYANGESIDEIAQSLAEDSNAAFGDARAELIARTEIVGGSNFGTLQGYKQSGVVTQKTWLATPGTKGSRESHEDLDGDTIDLDDEWTDSETGATALHPGGFGDPASDCNCRCAVTAAVDDPDDGKAFQAKALRTHAHHAAARAPHEAKMRSAAASVLNAQLAAVVKRLRAAAA